MNSNEKLAVIGFHIKRANETYDKIWEISRNIKTDPDFRDERDLETLSNYLKLQVDLAYCIVKGYWPRYITLVNFHQLPADELPGEWLYYKETKSLITVLKDKPTKRKRK